MFEHEEAYRGKETLEKISKTNILVCGIGALGSNLVDNLARQGFKRISVIDFDRVEEKNISTQVWSMNDVGKTKVQALCDRMFEVADIDVFPFYKKLDKSNLNKIIKDHDVVVDCFDNHESRLLLKGVANCLHIGLAADYCEIVWDDKYVVPQDNDEDVCDYPLTRNMVLFAVAIASEQIIRKICGNKTKNLCMTINDLNIGNY